jgi:deoxycytidylate deaminase
MTVSRKILDAALIISKKSNFKKQPMGCVAAQGKRIIASGYNSIYGSGKTTLHAEQHVIEQLARRHRLLPNLRKLLKMYDTPKVNSKSISQVTLPVYGEPQCRKDRTL